MAKSILTFFPGQKNEGVYKNPRYTVVLVVVPVFTASWYNIYRTGNTKNSEYRYDGYNKYKQFTGTKHIWLWY